MSKEKALSEEAGHMVNSSCEFVLRVYGIYRGCPQIGPNSRDQQGIVMEFMERGSVQSLLNNLSGPPPWPLAFRLAHQVALGMNFLHSRNLMHHDIKPSNVLLDKDLNAKVSASILNPICLNEVWDWLNCLFEVRLLLLHYSWQTSVYPGFPPVLWTAMDKQNKSLEAPTSTCLQRLLIHPINLTVPLTVTGKHKDIYQLSIRIPLNSTYFTLPIFNSLPLLHFVIQLPLKVTWYFW